MRIVESQIIGKQSQETCEDGIVMTDDFVAVIDGSTSKADVRYSPDVSNGRLCMQIVSHVISEQLTPDSTVTDFCRLTAEAVSSYYPQKPVKADNNLMAASAVVLNVRKREVWFVGDCLCLIDGILYEYPKPEEEINAQKRSDYIHELLKEGRATVEGLRIKDVGRDCIKNELRSCCERQNRDYAVINGMDIPENLIHVISVADAKEIVLASDGYPVLKRTLAESERELERIINNDPLCINLYKATKGVMQGYKSFDDRTFVRIEIDGVK
jgi:glycerophosphoryl diester phosphodiesterase